MESQCLVSKHLTGAGETLLFLLADKCHVSPGEAGGGDRWDGVK